MDPNKGIWFWSGFWFRFLIRILILVFLMWAKPTYFLSLCVLWPRSLMSLARRKNHLWSEQRINLDCEEEMRSHEESMPWAHPSIGLGKLWWARQVEEYCPAYSLLCIWFCSLPGPGEGAHQKWSDRRGSLELSGGGCTSCLWHILWHNFSSLL